jgi:hypothetical protein
LDTNYSFFVAHILFVVCLEHTAQHMSSVLSALETFCTIWGFGRTCNLFWPWHDSLLADSMCFSFFLGGVHVFYFCALVRDLCVDMASLVRLASGCIVLH